MKRNKLKIKLKNNQTQKTRPQFKTLLVIKKKKFRQIKALEKICLELISLKPENHKNHNKIILLLLHPNNQILWLKNLLQIPIYLEM